MSHYISDDVMRDAILPHLSLDELSRLQRVSSFFHHEAQAAARIVNLEKDVFFTRKPPGRERILLLANLLNKGNAASLNHVHLGLVCASDVHDVCVNGDIPILQYLARCPSIKSISIAILASSDEESDSDTDDESDDGSANDSDSASSSSSRSSRSSSSSSSDSDSVSDAPASPIRNERLDNPLHPIEQLLSLSSSPNPSLKSIAIRLRKNLFHSSIDKFALNDLSWPSDGLSDDCLLFNGEHRLMDRILQKFPRLHSIEVPSLQGPDLLSLASHYSAFLEEEEDSVHHLRSLSTQNCSETKIEHWTQFSTVCHHLESLSLENAIDITEARLAPVLRAAASSLQSLGLHVSDKVTGRTMSQLTFPSLDSLRLRFFDFVSGNAESLASSISASCPHITHLEFSGVQDSAGGFREIGNLSELESIDISGCRTLDDQEAGFAIMKSSKELTRLDVRETIIGRSQFLRYLPSLTHLSIGGQLTSGSLALKTMAQFCTRLESLTIQANSDDLFAESFFQLFSSPIFSSSLRHLELQHCKVSMDQICIMLRTIPRSSLESIRFSGYGEVCLESIASIITSTSSFPALTQVDISGCNFIAKNMVQDEAALPTFLQSLVDSGVCHRLTCLRLPRPQTSGAADRVLAQFAPYFFRMALCAEEVF